MEYKAIFSPEVPQLLETLNISLMMSTYQAGKVIILSAQNGKMVQLLRDFDRPMGIALNGEQLALALRLSVAIFRNDPTLAKTYPKKPDTYDSLYFPIAINKTDFVDTHDLFFTNQGLVSVNTAFSCLSKVDGTFSFQPIWQPPFISDLMAEDRCHLNGMAVDADGNIRYVTAFGETDSTEGWRTNKLKGGVIVDVNSGQTVVSGLGMPHSPRLHGQQLYVLSSATEELLLVDPATKTIQSVAKLDGFIRGLSFKGDYAFIGTSTLRKSHTFGDLPIANKKIKAGVHIVNLRTRSKVGEILYEEGLSEIYDVHVLDGKRRPNILNLPMSEQFRAMITPMGAQWVAQQGKQAKETSCDVK